MVTTSPRLCVRVVALFISCCSLVSTSLISFSGESRLSAADLSRCRGNGEGFAKGKFSCLDIQNFTPCTAEGQECITCSEDYFDDVGQTTGGGYAKGEDGKGKCGYKELGICESFYGLYCQGQNKTEYECKKPNGQPAKQGPPGGGS